MSTHVISHMTHGSEEERDDHQFMHTQRACDYYIFGKKEGNTEYCYRCNEAKQLHNFKYVCGYCGSILNEKWFPTNEDFDNQFQYQKVEGACCISKNRLGDFRS